MPNKRRREQLKSARAASLEVYKKRRSEANSLPNSAQLWVDDRKLSTSTADTTDTEGESGTSLWNESANETDSDTEDEENGNHEKDLEGNESRTEEAVSSEVHKVEIKWSREGQDKLRGGYGKGSKRTQMRHQKSAREFLQNIRYLGIMATKSRPGQEFNS